MDDAYFTHPEEFITEEHVHNWISEDMNHLANQLGKFERVKAFIIKRRPFTLEAGEMTPTQKTKRKVIEQKYADEIKSMYQNIS